MFTTRNLKAAGALLIAAACLFPNATPGATLPPAGVNLGKAHPGLHTAKPPKKRPTAKRAADTLLVTPRKLSKIKNAVPRRWIRPGYHLPR